jgi:hypothetical protein
MKTNYLDVESQASGNDAEIFAITCANNHAAPYTCLSQKSGIEDEQEEILQDIDKKLKHQTVALEPAQSAFPPYQPMVANTQHTHQCDPSSSRHAHASKPTQNQHQDHAPAPAPAHKVDHPHIKQEGLWPSPWHMDSLN